MPIIRKDPKLEAERYFEENHLHELISELMTQLLKERPEDPYTFLIEQTLKMKRYRETGEKPDDYYTHQDKVTLFTMFLPQGHEKLTPEECQKALDAIYCTAQCPDHDVGEEEFVALIN